MIKYEAEDRLLAQFVAMLFNRRYPELEDASVTAYTAAALQNLDYALGMLLDARQTGAIGPFYTEFRVKAI